MADAEFVRDAHTAHPSLVGRKAVITGGTTGIGRAIAILLASEGVRVFICGRMTQHLEDALGHIREVGEADGINVDLSLRDDVERFFKAADDYLGSPDIAVINAAVPGEGLADTSEEDLYYQAATNFTAYLACTREAVRRMEAGSDVILIGSMSAESRSPESTVYVAAKAGIEAFSMALRKELSEKDIKVGLIEPGFTGTDFQYPDFPSDKQAHLIKEHRMLRAEDIAVAAHFMLRQPRRAAVSMVRIETRLKHP